MSLAEQKLKNLQDLIDNMKIEDSTKNIEQQNQHFTKQLQNDDEIKKLRKKQKKFQVDFGGKSKDNISLVDIVDTFNKLVSEIKYLHEDHYKQVLIRENYIKEKEILEQENQKLQTQKTTLENFHKQLSKQMQDGVDGHKKAIEDEKVKKQAVIDKLQMKAKEIQEKVDSVNQVRNQKFKENEILKEKLKDVDAQYQQREKTFETEIKKTDVESSLNDTAIDQKLAEIEKDAVNQDESEKSKLQEEKNKFTAQEEQYQQKLGGIQLTLARSNECFGTFKQVMDKMSQQIEQLEDQNMKLNNKIEKSLFTIMSLVDENNVLKKEIIKNQEQKKVIDNLLTMVQNKQ